MGEVTTVERDPTTGYPTTLIQPDGTRVLRQFDAAGNLLSVKDPLNRETQFARNTRGQVSTITDASGRATQNQYDATTGQLAAVVDALGQATQYQRDGLGRVVRRTTPAGQVTQVEYCYCGQPSAIIDAAGQTTRYEFDSLGRRTPEASASPLAPP
jgi:YD repeat-containing protein